MGTTLCFIFLSSLEIPKNQEDDFVYLLYNEPTKTSAVQIRLLDKSPKRHTFSFQLSTMEQPTQQQPSSPETAPILMAESPVTDNKGDRRMSDEWDAAKTPPSRFQKRKGSIYATPSSRDGHIDRNYADKYHAKIAEMSKSNSK